MAAIDLVIPGAKVRSAWGNNVANEVNQLRGFLYPVNVPAGLPWHVGPQLLGADGWSFVPANLGTATMGYRGATAAATKYAWATRMLVGATPSDAIAAKGQLVVTGGRLAMDGTNSLWWPDYAGNMWMQDTTWFRIDKSLYLGTGVLATDGNGLAVKSGGAVTVGYVVDVRGDVYISGTISPQSPAPAVAGWNSMQVRAMSTTSGAGGSAGMSMWSGGNAPIFMCDGSWGAGETLFCRNNPNTAFVQILASGFVVNSTLRAKDDIAPVSVLDKIAQLEAKRFKFKIRPQTLRKSDKFVDLDQRWQAKGRKPLTLQQHHHQSHDHDCVVDSCPGTKDSPCAIAVNDSHNIGLVAEDVHKVFPEAVMVDKDHRPDGIDVSQIAGIAIGGISELYKKFLALTDRVTSLEKELATIKGGGN